jgi:CPA2 family monovalent cation:H+ antiporter-2
MLLNVDLSVFQDFLVIFGLAIVVQLICHQIRLPAIIGFLVTGAIAGPHLTGLVSDTHQVEIMAEIGVILLLFTLGMEFSFRNLIKIRKSVLLGGGIQVIFTIIAVWAICAFSGLDHSTAVFIGFLLALSSTAIVIKLLQQKGQIDSLPGRTVLGILIFQDIVIVPMMLITPLLSGKGGNLGIELLLMLLKFILIGGLVYVFSRFLVPKLLISIARTRTQEIFLMSVITLCFAIAWLTSSVGLSLSLGAFLAGLILSESEYSHQALGSVLPFRDMFTSIFFISVGMLLNVHYIFANVWSVGLALIAVTLLKLLTGFGAASALKLTMRNRIIVALSLFQVGEFSFILAGIGLQEKLLDADAYQLFLAVSVCSMMFTPAAIGYSGKWADKFLKVPVMRHLKFMGNVDSVSPDTRAWLNDHLVIVGFGLNGRNLAHAAKVSGIRYVIIETNPDTVHREKKNREPIFFGDASQEEILHHAEIKKARILVIAISDPAGSRKIVRMAKLMNPGIHIVVRTRYVSEIIPLREIGANEVIPEEFETSVEIFTRVLEEFMVPANDIDEVIRNLRADNYALLSGDDRLKKATTRLTHTLPQLDVRTYRIRDNSKLCGRSLAQANLRHLYHINIIAIGRGEENKFNPNPEELFEAGDVLFILGKDSDIHAFTKYAEDKA